MHRMTGSELRHWAGLNHPISVTICAPLETAPPAKLNNGLRLRGLLDRAQTALREGDLGEKRIRAMFAPALDLIEDEVYWRTNGDPGLCLLMSPDEFGAYSLPFACAESCDVSSSFHIGPLAQSLQWDLPYHVLALSPKSVNLLRCTIDGFAPVELPADVPRRVEDMDVERIAEKSLQVHSGPRYGNGAQKTGMTHGHGDPRDDRQVQLVDFVRVLARALEPVLMKENLPVVLACVESYVPLVRDAFGAANLVDRVVAGSPDRVSFPQLWKKSLPIADALRASAAQRAIDRYLEAPREQIGHRIGAVLSEARAGRIDTLFAALDQRVWGTLNDSTVQMAPDNERRCSDVDVVNECAREAILHDAEVVMLPSTEMPGERQVAAIYRW